MPQRTVLHVGTMKSGTSHVQSRLFANAEALLAAGVLVPGDHWGHQVHGVRDLLAVHREGVASAGPWQRLAEQMAAHDGTSVVSMEYLGPAAPQVVRGIGETVPGLEVVITVRDLNRSLAAMWQETIQNGRSWTWEEYVAAAAQHRPGRRVRGRALPEAARTFWRQQDVCRIAGTWRTVAPVTVVTLPQPGAPRSLLWDRFCQVLGVPEGGWAEADGANESIGAASALVLRRLNELLDAAGMPFPAGSEVRKHYLAKEVLSARKKQEPAIGLPVERWLRHHAAGMVDTLRGMDLALVGDWDELEPVDVPGVDLDSVPESEVLEAAVAALAGLVQREVRRKG